MALALCPAAPSVVEADETTMVSMVFQVLNDEEAMSVEGKEARLGQEVLCPPDDDEVVLVAAEEDHTAGDTPSKPKGTGKATIDFKTVVA